jgi:hypothetical protein
MKLKSEPAAKRYDGAVVIKEACLQADRERLSLTAPSAEPAPHLASTCDAFYGLRRLGLMRTSKTGVACSSNRANNFSSFRL